MSLKLSVRGVVAVLSALSVTANAVIGIDGQPLSGSYDPTKCMIDRSDDLFKNGDHGGPSCARCITNNQCRQAYGSFQWFCCPYLKRCVNSSSMGCYDTAECSPRCFSESYPSLKAECSGCKADFPDNWVKGCHKSDWANLVSSSVPEQVKPTMRPVSRPVAPAVGGDACSRFNADGAACQAAAECEWSWNLSKCISAAGTCESIASGKTCSATKGCEWDWAHDCCVTSAGPCQRIGTDGLACSRANGCTWDWDLASCVASEAASAGKVDKRSKRGQAKQGDSDCSDATTNKACRMIDGCAFDKSSGVCAVKSTRRNASKNPCAKLKGKRCTRNSSCYLEGKVCLQRGDVQSAGSSGVSDGECSQLPRKLCTGQCKFDKSSRTCVSQ